MGKGPRFSIVTPSYQGGPWIPLCISSVADQIPDREHLIQDALSSDGSVEALPRLDHLQIFRERDEGMYDALNRGFQRAEGEIFAWLNCDEQYLPDTLKKVSAFFDRNPSVDIVFGDVVVVNPAGDYLFHRKMILPRLAHTWTVHLSTLSCGMFFRRKMWEPESLRFNSDWKQGGDGEWMVRLLQGRPRMALLGEFTSVFSATGGNQSESPAALLENRALAEKAPFWMRSLRPLWILHHRLRRWWHGAYQQKPFGYSLYTLQNPNQRVEKWAKHPTTRWKLS